MKLRIGYQLQYDFPQPTPSILVLNVHFTRVSVFLNPDHILISPAAPISGYRDSFGNWCSRVVLGPGPTRISTNAVIRNSGFPDLVVPGAHQVAVESLPEEALIFSCRAASVRATDFFELAWTLFGAATPGWDRVQAICDFVHRHICFGYEHARATRTACEAYEERRGVCRDYAHLAVAFCRALNIPARYCTGYLGDVGTPPPFPPGDFAAWFEAYVGGGWYTFDPRNNTPRIGRVLLARGRDAADVAIAMTFGPNRLESFRVWTDEVDEGTV